MLASAGQAQGQVFERGYVVTTAGDTLRGELQNRFWQSPPTEVAFRPAADAPTRLFPRRSLRVFRLDGGRYFRAEVLPLDRNASTNVNSLSMRLSYNQHPDSLLAEVLVDGPVPLLRAVVDNVTHFFVRRPGQPYLELAERKYLARSNGRQNVVDANNYKAQLSVYFEDCPAAVTAANAAPFSAKGLAAVVQAFAVQSTAGKQAGAEFVALARPNRPIAVNAGVLVGSVFNPLRLNNNETGEEEPLFDGVNLDGRLHALGGAYVDVLLPGRKWAVHGEGVLNSYGRRGTFAVPGGAATYAWYGTRVDVRLGPRYAFVQQPTHELFAGAGLNMNFTTSSESEARYGNGPVGTTRLTSRNVRLPTQSGFIGVPSSGLGLYVEAGLRRGRFTLSLDAMIKDGFDYNDPLAVQTGSRSPLTPSDETAIYNRFNYSASLLTFRTVLAFRLNRQPDQSPIR
ncbi:hypothetical protein GCM10022407_40010 [Hymenobacter antarcticus]|uniref:Outer membrane protein beta-barrel family protein n=1 Tax=Hymenobacter antarcticus TaxID=486270 RepID=A0ABP7R3U8_9BACT